MDKITPGISTLFGSEVVDVSAAMCESDGTLLSPVERFHWDALPNHDWLIDWEPPHIRRTAISWATTPEDA